ncbi:MAG: DUF1579 domain-containing protein [Dehalococcoidia bacterium]
MTRQQYTGTKALYLGPPPAEAQLSPSSATGDDLSAGLWLIRYGWTFEGQPQDGSLLVHRGDPASGAGATAAWGDTFHQGDRLMFLLGETDDAGITRLRGSYPAPPGPDWGWRIELERTDGALSIRMFNITPDGQEAIGVDAQYTADG